MKTVLLFSGMHGCLYVKPDQQNKWRLLASTESFVFRKHLVHVLVEQNVEVVLNKHFKSSPVDRRPISLIAFKQIHVNIIFRTELSKSASQICFCVLFISENGQ